ncbi:MAG: hypothetical protein DMG38_17835 [Acidobacteria bacterium]|nr:MAG: hypothetical protein DMG38_17835 [Acidobacteriota bacterium]
MSPTLIPILLWILWRCSLLQQVIRRHLTGERIEDPAWELRMTFTFSGLLLLVVVIAFLLASMGYHPPTSSSLEKSNLKARDGYALVLRNDQKDCRG